MRRRTTYHHGNLREALLEAALRLIAEVGPEGFTLREVARRAGVSHNAPYRHFRDREEVLAAVAAEGFRELDLAMRGAAYGEDPLKRLKRAGLAYVEFALRRPEHFAVMFDAPVSKDRSGESTRASEEAFGTLMNLVKSCQENGRLGSGNTMDLALLAWTMVHGIAKLAVAGRLPYRGTAGVLKFARFVIDKSLPVSSSQSLVVSQRKTH